MDDFHIVSEDSEQTEDEEMNISMWRSNFEKKFDRFLLEKSERKWFVLIKYFDIFAGIGGFRSELEKADGFECVGYCEIDRYAKKAYEIMYDTRNEAYYDDARKIDPNELPNFDNG